MGGDLVLRGSDLHYRVRISSRAKYASLTVTGHDGLTVTVPKRFPQRDIPALVSERFDWIEQVAARIGISTAELSRPPAAPSLPVHIDFLALSQNWSVRYELDSEIRARVPEGDRGQLVVRAVDQSVALALLKRWTERVARRNLEPRLRILATDRMLEVRKVSIRSQKTLWASCSANANISLNRSLLFVRPELVRYVMLHELCHLKEMNHSPRFWRLLAEDEPRADEFRRQLRSSWRDIPNWAY